MPNVGNVPGDAHVLRAQTRYGFGWIAADQRQGDLRKPLPHQRHDLPYKPRSRKLIGSSPHGPEKEKGWRSIGRRDPSNGVQTDAGSDHRDVSAGSSEALRISGRERDDMRRSPKRLPFESPHPHEFCQAVQPFSCAARLFDVSDMQIGRNIVKGDE